MQLTEYRSPLEISKFFINLFWTGELVGKMDGLVKQLVDQKRALGCTAFRRQRQGRATPHSCMTMRQVVQRPPRSRQ